MFQPQAGFSLVAQLAHLVRVRAENLAVAFDGYDLAGEVVAGFIDAKLPRFVQGFDYRVGVFAWIAVHASVGKTSFPPA
jgi:hypothetical protein